MSLRARDLLRWQPCHSVLRISWALRVDFHPRHLNQPRPFTRERLADHHTWATGIPPCVDPYMRPAHHSIASCAQIRLKTQTFNQRPARTRRHSTSHARTVDPADDTLPTAQQPLVRSEAEIVVTTVLPNSGSAAPRSTTQPVTMGGNEVGPQPCSGRGKKA